VRKTISKEKAPGGHITFAVNHRSLLPPSGRRAAPPGGHGALVGTGKCRQVGADTNQPVAASVGLNGDVKMFTLGERGAEGETINLEGGGV